jgi:hypothetical protein
MTTSITVDAHAGWDVEVTIAEGSDHAGTFRVRIVPKNTKETFYVHSTMRITSIRELPHTATNYSNTNVAPSPT